MNGHLYYSNTEYGTFNRIRIDADGVATGAAEVLQSGSTPIDNFVFDNAGDGYCAQDVANVLSKVPANGTVTALVGNINDTYLAGATAAQVGRTALDSSVVYVRANGGQTKPVNGVVAPGKVVAVYTETYPLDPSA